MNDAARLSQDPTFRLISSRKIWERGAALTSRLQSFETELLTQEENLAGLAALNRELIAKAEAIASPRRVVLDMDSTEVRVHGRQEQSAYNGHFESTCYHPLLLFNREGDCLAAKLRPGNVHSADGWENCCCPRSSGSRRRARKWLSAATPPLPSRSCTRRWKRETLSTPFAFPPTTTCSGTCAGSASRRHRLPRL